MKPVTKLVNAYSPPTPKPFLDLTVTENVIIGALARTSDLKTARDRALESSAPEAMPPTPGLVTCAYGRCERPT
jgi:hypothetical protein